MFRRAIVLFVLMLPILPVLGQEVLLDVRSPLETEKQQWGQNRRHFIHSYVTFDCGIYHGTWIAQQLKMPRAFGFGLQYKIRMTKHFDLGADLEFQRYSLIRHNGFLPGFPMPDSLLQGYNELIIRRQSVPIDLFIRINSGRRGDYISWHLDLGAYMDLGIAQRRIMTIDRGDGIMQTSRDKAEGYFHGINEGIMVRLGYSRYSIAFRYRLSPLLDTTKFSSDIGPYSLEFRLGLF
jgi:hypothetical protein